MPEQTTAVTRTDRPAAPIEVLRSELEARAGEFRMVLPSHITPEKLQRTVLTAVQQNPDLLRCDRRSFLTACMKAAQDGLLPDKREAAIVPFNHRYKDDNGWHSVKLAQYLPMAFGLRKKILQSGEIRDIYTGVVYRQEIETEPTRFVYEEGTERTLRHKPIVDPGFVPTDDDIALAYSIATFTDGTKSFEVLRRWQIDEIREASQTGALFDAKGNRREPKGPWVEWFSEMARKSVLRRHSKSLPMSGDIITDVEGDDIAFAAKSAVALLDSRKPDAPEREPGPQPFERFDSETGEVYDEPEPKPEPEPEPEPKRRRGRPPKAEQAPPPPAPEPEPDEPEPPEPEPDEPDADLSEPDLTYEGDEIAAEAEAAVTDEYGITKDPNEAAAEDYIARAKRCETIVDLKALEREADIILAAMPAETAAFVDEEFARARQRLTPAPRVE